MRPLRTGNILRGFTYHVEGELRWFVATIWLPDGSESDVMFGAMTPGEAERQAREWIIRQTRGKS